MNDTMKADIFVDLLSAFIHSDRLTTSSLVVRAYVTGSPTYDQWMMDLIAMDGKYNIPSQTVIGIIDTQMKELDSSQHFYERNVEE